MEVLISNYLLSELHNIINKASRKYVEKFGKCIDPYSKDFPNSRNELIIEQLVYVTKKLYELINEKSCGDFIYCRGVMADPSIFIRHFKDSLYLLDFIILNDPYTFVLLCGVPGNYAEFSKHIRKETKNDNFVFDDHRELGFIYENDAFIIVFKVEHGEPLYSSFYPNVNRTNMNAHGIYSIINSKGLIL